LQNNLSNLNYASLQNFAGGDFSASSSDLNLHWNQSNVAALHNRSLSPAM
jgi:hypothetical protein